MSPHAIPAEFKTYLPGLLTPIGADAWPEVPDVTSLEQLLDLHRQLLEAAQLGDDYLHAAGVIYDLFRVLDRGRTLYEQAPTEDTWTVTSTVVKHVVDGLRNQSTDEAKGCFDAARGWLDHLSMQVTHAKHIAKAEVPA